jgi:ribosomal protection tetracycline resistance protein
MGRTELSLGILAHVDAGKTTLTERLLFEAGVIAELGSVDAGSTLTDSLALERERGITIESAVASFYIDDVHVNLIDTPGHPDFIAEVERVLDVLDGVVLVVSAVEAVQPQTRILFRVLRKLRLPTIIFVNKVDRVGADVTRVIERIRRQLSPSVVILSSVREMGARSATSEPVDLADLTTADAIFEQLADFAPALLVPDLYDLVALPNALHDTITQMMRAADLYPVIIGSALTGAGVGQLTSAVTHFRPPDAASDDSPLTGSVFKIERGSAGERIAFVRIFTGSIRTRDRVHLGENRDAKVTSIAVFERGRAEVRNVVSAGGVAKIWGLSGVRVGDRLGDEANRVVAALQFTPPTMTAVVEPANDADRQRLRVALTQLAEQDPLINVHQNDAHREISVCLYGEVQREVIQATLAADYGLAVTFNEVTPICVERPVSTGRSSAELHADTNPFNAGLGLRIAPANPGTGVAFAVDVNHSNVPLYLFGTVTEFTSRMGQFVQATLDEGLYGWLVTDCTITIDECVYSNWDGPPSRRGPLSTLNDFRKLVPVVVMRALAHAATVVCEPTCRASIEVPSTSVGAVLATLSQLRALAPRTATRGDVAVIDTELTMSAVNLLRRRLGQLTSGDGVIDTEFIGYRPVIGQAPTRRRTSASPLDLQAYVREVGR